VVQCSDMPPTASVAVNKKSGCVLYTSRLDLVGNRADNATGNGDQ